MHQVIKKFWPWRVKSYNVLQVCAGVCGVVESMQTECWIFPCLYYFVDSAQPCDLTLPAAGWRLCEVWCRCGAVSLFQQLCWRGHSWILCLHNRRRTALLQKLHSKSVSCLVRKCNYAKAKLWPADYLVPASWDKLEVWVPSGIREGCIVAELW